MSKYFFKSSLLIAIAFVGASSCKKDVTADTSNAVKPAEVSVENGYLAFNNSAQFSKTLDDMATGKLTAADLQSRYGFESANTFFERANNEFAALGNQEQFQRFLKKYEGQIEYTKDSTLRLINGAALFNSLLNKDGMVKIGKKLVRYGKDRIYESETASADELLQAGNTTNARSGSDITVINFNKGRSHQEMARTTNAPYEAYRATNQWSSSNRKFWLELVETFNIEPYYGTISDQILGNKDGYLCFYRMQVFFTSQKKVLFGWTNYNADYSITEMKYNCNMAIQPVASVIQPNGKPNYHFPFENVSNNYSGADKWVGSGSKFDWSMGRWEALSPYTYWRIFVDKNAFSEGRVAVPVADFNTPFSCIGKNSAMGNYLQITYSN
ncbi:hypothetical protein [Chitinophaga vietnamensis]|uniref:hypothetical protein n=1 Tax=Chitinophaga vietnamensis TaxID=2593957 RepID=UPI0011789BC6|nr:hypothetical protein [Chitinophaga vietnamensis]